MSPASYLTAPPRVAAARVPQHPGYDAAMDWWIWAILGWALVALAVTVLIVVNALRRARAAERRAAGAAQDLVRMTDDLERRIHEVREETARAEHRIEIVDEGRDKRAPFPEEEPDDPARPAT